VTRVLVIVVICAGLVFSVIVVGMTVWAAWRPSRRSAASALAERRRRELAAEVAVYQRVLAVRDAVRSDE
jgi:hypothetical protein